MAARCPICTLQFDDVNAVRRHTLIEHGVSSDPTTVAGPGDEAGWFPDPWNATLMRWWDGRQWSGRTAPLGAPPPEMEASGREPKRGFAGRERRGPVDPILAASRPKDRPGGQADGGPARTARGPFIAIGAIAVVLVVIVVAVAVSSGKTPRPAKTAAPPATLAPVPTTGASSGVGLIEGVLTPADIGGGWTATIKPTGLTQHDYNNGPCGSPLWVHDVAGYRTRLENGGGGIVHSGIVDSLVYEADSDADAKAQADFVTSPSFVPCVKAEVSAELDNVLTGSSQSLGELTADPLTLQLPTTNVGYAFQIGLIDQSLGQGTFLVDDHIEVFTNRYEGVLDLISDSSNPLDQTLIQQEASRLADRLSALPAGGTLAGHAV